MNNLIQGCLVEAVITDWDDSYLLERQQVVLDQIYQCQVPNFILDVSAVDSIDSLFISYVTGTLKMASLLGARVVLTGISAGMAASIVTMDIKLPRIKTLATVNEALSMLTCQQSRI